MRPRCRTHTKPGRAKKHFQCLRLAFPGLKGVCLVDADMVREVEAENGNTTLEGPNGLSVVRWKRYEIENYLLNPSLLTRFLERDIDLLNRAEVQRDVAHVELAFEENFPRNVDWLSNIPVLAQIKGSSFLVEVLSKTSRPVSKRDLFMVAAKSRSEEVHPDVKDVLARIAQAMPSVAPSVVANTSVLDETGVEGGNEVEGGNASEQNGNTPTS
jgi:hypothetical protein